MPDMDSNRQMAPLCLPKERHVILAYKLSHISILYLIYGLHILELYYIVYY